MSTGPQKAARAATVGFVGMVAFQMLLALGLPLGKAAWGGEHTTLPAGLRIGSLVSAGLFLVAIYAVRARAGLRTVSPESRFARFGTWAFAILFLLSALANAASRSPWERWLMAPVAIVLSALCFVVARGDVATEGQPRR